MPAVTTTKTETKPKAKKTDIIPIVQVDGTKVIACNLCPKLCESRTRIVNGRGPKKARIAIIGDHPGEIEDERGIPFLGAHGQTLKRWLEKLGVDPSSEVYYDYAVRCKPKEGKNLTDKEIRNCRAYLIANLEVMQPDIIVAAGNNACKALLPAEVSKQGITKIRGHVFWDEQLQRKIIPMFSPSSVLFEFANEPLCMHDLRKALKEGKKPTKKPEGLGEYIPLLDVDDVERICAEMAQGDVLVFDTETSHNRELTCAQAGDKGGLDIRNADVLCIGFTNEVGKAYIVPIVGQHYRQIWSKSEYKRVIKALRRMFKSDVPKVGQNGKFDIHMLRRLGIKVNEYTFDTMLAFALIQESISHGLETLRSLFTTMPFYDGEIYDETQGKKHMELGREDVLWKYCGADVDCTLRVAKELIRLLEEEGEDVEWVFYNITMPLSHALRRVEERGVAIDMELADSLVDDAELLIKEMEKKVLALVPKGWENFNYNSWQQKQKLLYDVLKLPLPPIIVESAKRCQACKKPRTQHWYHTSTDKEAIKTLVGKHPIVAPLATLTQLITLRKTFLLGEDGEGSGLLHNVADDHRIHTSYRVDGTETGRISSSPNLQNIPKGDKDDRPEIYYLLRKLFIGGPGKGLLEADYSNLELRIFAYVANEKAMIERFEANDDFHLFVAKYILYPNLDPDMPDKEWKNVHSDKRDEAKTFNFGLAYGLTLYGLMQKFNWTEKKAQQMIDRYFSFLGALRKYYRKRDRDINERGFVEDALGRRRHFHGVHTMKHFQGYKRHLGHMRREAYNMPIQGTGSDLLSLATIEIDADPWFEEHECFIVLTVHDSVTLEAPTELLMECAHRVKKIMDDVPRKYFDWYIPAEVKIGPRWSDWDYFIDMTGKVENLKEAA